MDRSDLDVAIRMLCQRFRWHTSVDILIVGGAAGMLTGLLPRDRVTIDCYIIQYVPESAWASVELLADEIGAELSLPTNWFNSQISMRPDLLPDGWRDRRVWIESGESLHAYAISRPDLIAMKFFAHRPQDLRDLATLDVTADDIAFVRAYLTTLPPKGTPAESITEAAYVLEHWSDAE
jgi:hypothetical protein